MAFSEQRSYQLYGDSSATEFYITDFYYQQEKDIRVVVYQSDNTIIEKTMDTDWKIEGQVVSRLTTWEAGEVLIYRSNAYQQLSTYKNAEKYFDRELLEFQLDYITMLTQQNKDNYIKSIRAPIFDEATDFELPTIANRVGKFITFDSEGNIVVRELIFNDISDVVDIEWDSEYTEYHAGFFASYNNKLYVAVNPVTGSAPGTVPGEWELVSQRWQDQLKWDTQTIYETGDITFYDDQLWIAASPVQGSAPGVVTGEWTVTSQPSPFSNTVELIPYGEAMTSGELFLDGTNEYVSSEGREPVEAVVDYVPALRNIDGIDYEPDELKWSGKGTYGFFGEYENVAGGELVPRPKSEVSQEGDWTKVMATEATTNDSATASIKEFTALSTKGFMSIVIRRGNTDVSSIAIDNSITIYWNSKNITGDVNAKWLSDDIVLITYILLNAGATTLQLYPKWWADATEGDYTYYKDWMVVDLDYPVPYTKGVHQENKLQYNVDWAESDTWTIEGWFYIKEDSYSVSYPRMWSAEYGVFRVYYSVGSKKINFSHGDSSIAMVNPMTQFGWTYIKVWTNGTDGGLIVNNDPPVLISNTLNLAALHKQIKICSEDNFANLLDSYVSDFRIYKGEDTSTTHYQSGLPYYNPNKTYGKNASWSIDERGNISGIPQETGRIIEEYELDGQHVTKWDSGRMEIRGEKVFSSTIETSFFGGYRTDVSVTEFLESFEDIPNVVASPDLNSGFGVIVNTTTKESSNLNILSVTSDSNNVSRTIQFIAVGRWK